MKFYKLLVYILITILVISCSRKIDYSKDFKQQWVIHEMYYKQKNLISEGIFTLGFEDNQRMWINNLKGEVIVAKYNFFKRDSYVMLNVKSSNEEKLNAVYNVHLDTLASSVEGHIVLQLTLESQNILIRGYTNKPFESTKYD